MRGQTKYAILTTGMDVRRRGGRLVSVGSFPPVNSSHRNVGGSECRFWSFIKAGAPPASGINLDNSATPNRPPWSHVMEEGHSWKLIPFSETPSCPCLNENPIWTVAVFYPGAKKVSFKTLLA